MYLYITVGTNDLAKAQPFYDAVMPVLGLVCRSADGEELGYGLPAPARITFWVTMPFDKSPATVGNGSMLAFQAATRAQVDAFHAAGLGAAGRDEGAPGLRPYGAHFYACYLRDPDGNKLSVVCETPE